MNIGKALFNATGVIAVASILAACSSSSSSSNPPPPAASTPVGGAAFKGAFVQGSAVTACPFADAVATGSCDTVTTKATTTTTDANGTFSLATGVTWAGPSLVTVSGNYLNEITGNTNQTGTLKAVLVLGAAGGAAVSANPNIATTIAAEMLLAQAKANPGMVVDAAAAQTAGFAACAALGLPAGTDPNTLTLSNPAMLTISAAFADVLASGVDLSAVATAMAKDVSSGLPLGSSPVLDATGAPTAFNLAAAITASIATASNPANYAVLPPGVTPIAVDTTLKGYGLSNNTLTVGDANLPNSSVASCVIAEAAPATAVCTGNAPAMAPIFNFAFVNDGAPTTLATTIYFDIADSVAQAGKVKRRITGSIPVTMSIDANGKATATVATDAVLTFTGMTSAGVEIVAATVSNLAGNTRVFDTTGGASTITVNPVKLRDQIVAKMGAVMPGLLDFTIAGTYDFKFGTNAPVGLLDAANTSIVRLVPLAVSGQREISGSVTIQ